MARYQSEIYLRSEIIDGKKKIVDQDGREVAGLIFCSSEYGTESFDKITITAIEHGPSGDPLVSGGHR